MRIKLLLMSLLLSLAGCDLVDGGGPAGPPAGAGADPSGTWHVQMILRAFVGPCNETTVHEVLWNFVPTGTDQWDVEMRDLNGLSVGTLEAEQVGLQLVISGQILGWGSVSVREYDSNDLYATPTALVGEMTVTNTGTDTCIFWGPLNGLPGAPASLHADSHYEGSLEFADGSAASAWLIQEAETGTRLGFADGEDRILSPPLERGPDGVMSALFRPRGARHEYAFVAREGEHGRILGELSALHAHDGSIAWRARVHLARSSALSR